MGAGFSEALDLFQSSREIQAPNVSIQQIRTTAQHEIELTEGLIRLFSDRSNSRTNGIAFSEIRRVIKDSPLFREYCESLTLGSGSDLPDHNDDDILDPISRDLMALDAAETRELALLALSSCADQTDLQTALMKYKEIPKAEIKERALHYLRDKWEIHPALIEGWIKQ